MHSRASSIGIGSSMLRPLSLGNAATDTPETSMCVSQTSSKGYCQVGVTAVPDTILHAHGHPISDVAQYVNPAHFLPVQVTAVDGLSISQSQSHNHLLPHDGPIILNFSRAGVLPNQETTLFSYNPGTSHPETTTSVKRKSRANIMVGCVGPLTGYVSILYELPTADTIGAIVYEGGPESTTDYDIVIERHSREAENVNKLHPRYMALQFPLLFIYGEEGYHLNLTLRNLEDSETQAEKKMTMKVFYAYQVYCITREIIHLGSEIVHLGSEIVHLGSGLCIGFCSSWLWNLHLGYDLFILAVNVVSAIEILSRSAIKLSPVRQSHLRSILLLF
ncbi:hypothetical protein CTI12_AA176160 [Artemisia annua]|uniref:Uncharacterized protein n=1 Tax=Artemisia annua TaxID=35608 RepID=A0A2U1P996_ARTAN|nr:hypothetical protein CTI12_AA176160 [Artemisia annua]